MRGAYGGRVMTTSILDKVISCPRLPVLPPVAVELMELIRDPGVEPGRDRWPAQA